jgi:hypothetical protein
VPVYAIPDGNPHYAIGERPAVLGLEVVAVDIGASEIALVSQSLTKEPDKRNETETQGGTQNSMLTNSFKILGFGLNSLCVKYGVYASARIDLLKGRILW